VSGSLVDENLEQLAMERLVRVLGAPAARRTYEAALSEAGVEKLSTPDDLYAFAAVLSKRPGFEGAIGGLLCVAAVLRGATRRA
jgi:hypothetical protein